MNWTATSNFFISSLWWNPNEQKIFERITIPFCRFEQLTSQISEMNRMIEERITIPSSRFEQLTSQISEMNRMIQDLKHELKVSNSFWLPGHLNYDFWRVWLGSIGSDIYTIRREGGSMDDWWWMTWGATVIEIKKFFESCTFKYQCKNVIFLLHRSKRNLQVKKAVKYLQ